MDQDFDVVLITGTGDSSPVMRTSGAYRIATELRRAGYTVKVLDFITRMRDGTDLTSRALLKYVSSRTLWVGLSSTFKDCLFKVIAGEHQSQLKMHDTLAALKAKLPKLKVVMGGASAYMQNVPLVDFYLEGYADATVIDFTRMLSGRVSSFSYSTDSTGSCRATYDRKGSRFNFVRRGDIEYHDSDSIQQGEALPIEISRGCIFSCKFCSYPLNGKTNGDYIKDTGLLREEFVRNYERHGTTYYTFVDDTFNDSTGKLESMLKIVQGLPFKLRFAAYCRVDLVSAHREQVDLLRELGLAGVFFGIESMHQKTAQAIGKGGSRERVWDFVKELRTLWPYTSIGGGFITGLPYDTEETMSAWLKSLTSPESPFHSAHVNALRLSGDTNRPWRSDLEINSSKYGYLLHGEPKPNQPWSNSITGMTSQLADSYAFQTMRWIRQGPRPFEVPVMLSLGVSMPTILESERSSDDFLDYGSRLNQQLIGYVKQTLG